MTLEDLRKPQIEDDADWDVVASRMDFSKAEFLALDRKWNSIANGKWTQLMIVKVLECDCCK